MIATLRCDPRAIRKACRLSQECHANPGKWWQIAIKRSVEKEKITRSVSSQLADCLRLSPIPASFGKITLLAVSQMLERFKKSKPTILPNAHC
jgi:hypothetical protein